MFHALFFKDWVRLGAGVGLGCLGWAGVELTQTRFRSTPVLKCGGKGTQLNTGVELTGLSPVIKSQHQKQDNTNKQVKFNTCVELTALNSEKRVLAPRKKVKFNTSVERAGLNSEKTR